MMKLRKLLTVFILNLILLSLSLLVPRWSAQANKLPGVVGRIDAPNEWPAAPVQMNATNRITVTTTADVINAADGLCSLREAIISANDNPVAFPLFGECRLGKNNQTDTIVLESGATYNLTISGLGIDKGDLDILNNLMVKLDVEIIVADGGTATIDAQAINDRILDIVEANVSVTGLILKNGGNGAIRNEGILTLIDSQVTRSIALYGGGIANSGALTLINTSIVKNEATGGGGIFNSSSSTLTLIQSQIQENKNSGVGFGFEGGGGIYNNEGVVSVQDSAIRLNQTDEDGGGIYNYGGVVTVSNGLFEGNETETGISGGNGGAIYNEMEGQVTMINTTFRAGNLANSGGAIYNQAGTVELQGSLFEDNIVPGLGGAIFNRDGLTMSQTNARFNKAQQGGAIYNIDGALAILDQSNIYSNEATNNHGGGIYQSSGTLTVTNSSIMTNTSPTNGGGVRLTGGQATFANATIGGNLSDSGGGVYIDDNASASFFNATVANNEATSGAALAKTLNGDVVLANTILSGPDGSTCFTNGTTLTSQGHNLLRDNTCPIIDQPGDMTNTDPKLGPLTEENGTFIYKPAGDSPTLDAGDAAICAGSLVNNIDQVGAPRPIGDGCEIGAAETAGVIDPPGEGEGPVQIFLPLVIK